MQISIEALVAILGMALVTYGTRVGGFWLLGRVAISKQIEVWLRYIPGCVLMAIVAPAVLSSGPAGAVATVTTVLAAVRFGNLPVAMVVGVATLLLVRLALG
jgi:uncharacterized membrane protein